MRRRSWDCCLILFERHNSLGDKTMRQEQGRFGVGGGCYVRVECDHAVIDDKTVL